MSEAVETDAKRRTSRRRRWPWITLAVLVVLVAFGWVNNTSLFSEPPGRPLLLAHRGIAQTFDPEGIENDTCTAERIHAPTHPYLENTIASMEAAFAAGADIVEFDVHITADDKFAVFHDWTVDCRTNGSGVTHELTLAELKKLDIGYGYTADGGRTFPFRGKGVGLMPSLDEVLDRFGGRQLVIHVKSDDRAEGDRLADRLAQLPADQQEKLTVYGGDNPVDAVKQRLPEMRVISKATMIRCLGWYVGVGWTGYVPGACRRTQLHIPEGIAPYLWGWPHKFVDRMAAYDTRVVLVAGSGGFSEGFDDAASLDRLPDGFSGVIWTNRIDIVAPHVRRDR